MKKMILLALTLLAAFSLAGCQSSKTDLEYIMEKETFVVGFTDFPPMGFSKMVKPLALTLSLHKLSWIN